MTIMELRGLLGLLGKGSFIIFNAVQDLKKRNALDRVLDDNGKRGTVRVR